MVWPWKYNSCAQKLRIDDWIRKCLCNNHTWDNYEPTVILIQHITSSIPPVIRRRCRFLSIHRCIFLICCRKPQMMSTTSLFSPAPLSFSLVFIPLAWVHAFSADSIMARLCLHCFEILWLANHQHKSWNVVHMKYNTIYN